MYLKVLKTIKKYINFLTLKYFHLVDCNSTWSIQKTSINYFLYNRKLIDYIFN